MAPSSLRCFVVVLQSRLFQKRGSPVSAKFFDLEFCLTLIRSQLGLALLHLGLEGSSPEIRREVHTVIESYSTVLPQLINCVLRDGMNTFLSRGIPPSKSITSGPEEATISWNRHSRLSTLLLSAVSFSEELEVAIREDMIVELIVLGHHHMIC